MPKTNAVSPARSQGGIPTPKRKSTRGSRSLCSPALSTASGRLTSLIDQFKDKNMESFALSPLNGRSVLNDNTEIEEPRRKSWWKKLEENSQDVMEVLEDNKVIINNAIEEFVDIEVLSQEKKNYTLDLPESSDNESINSIVLPQRRLFTQKENQPQKKFGHLIDNRESLAKLPKTNPTNIDKSVNVGTRELFRNAKRSKPIFPAALLNISPNKTATDKTKENVLADPKPQVRNIFGNRPANKRKNMFADFIVSESEDEISEIQPKVFGFQKKLEQRRFSSASKGRDPSPSSSITTDIEMDFRNMLPSSTMVENQLEEMMVSTPVKRTRLSKLSEAKESEAGTNTLQTNSTVSDKTKQSNKSASSKNKSKSSPEIREKSLNSSRTTRSMLKTTSIHEKEDAKNNKSQNKSKGNDLNVSSSKSDNDKRNTTLNKSQTQSKSRTRNSSRAMETDIDSEEISPSNKSLQKIEKIVKTVEESLESKTEQYSAGDNIDGVQDQVILNKITIKETEQNNDEEMVDQEIHEDINNSRKDNDEKLEQENEVSIGQESDEEANESEQNEDELNVSQENEDKQNESEEVGMESQEIENEENEGEEDEEEGNESDNNEDEASESHEVEAEVNESQEIEENANENQVVAEKKNDSQQIEEDVNESQEVAAEESKSREMEEDVNERQEIEREADSQEVEKEANKSQENAEMADEEVNAEENESEAVEAEQEIQEDANESQEMAAEEIVSQEIEEDANESQEEENESQETEEDANESQGEENESQETEEDANESQEAAEEEIEEDANESQEVAEEENESQEVIKDANESQDVEEEANESQYVEGEANESQEVEDDDARDENEVMSEDEKEAANESQVTEASANESQEVENDEGETNEVGSEDEVNESEEEDVDLRYDSDEADKAIASDPQISVENQVDEMEVDDDEDEEQESENESDQNEHESHEERQIEEQNETEPSEEIEESPNVTHDTTGRHRKKHLNKSPELILHDKTNQMDSFTAKGRNTSVRKSKSMISKTLNIRPSFAPHRDSTGFSDGTKNSSAEGSGWDSHRTTRKTLRQTFGKDFTPRKSLRALVMEKSAKRQTEHMEMHSETVKFPLANSTEMPEDSNHFVEDVVESDHEVSRQTRLTALEMALQKIKEQNMEKRLKLEAAVRNSLKNPPTNSLSLFKVPNKPAPRRLKPSQMKPKKQLKSIIPLDELPAEVIQDMKYKPPKRFRPSNASWITKRLYKFLEDKLEAKYDYKTRVRAEKLAETIYNFTKDLRRHDVAPADAVEVLKHEFARLDIVRTHFEFYEFFHEFMPREVRIKVVPDIVNKIPLPRHGVFSDILRD